MLKVLFSLLVVITGFSFAEHSTVDNLRRAEVSRRALINSWLWRDMQSVDLSDDASKSTYSILKHLTSFKLLNRTGDGSLMKSGEVGSFRYLIARLHCKQVTTTTKMGTRVREEASYECFLNDSNKPTFTKEWAKELMLTLKEAGAVYEASPTKKEMFSEIKTEQIWAQDLTCQDSLPSPKCSFFNGIRPK